MIRFPRRSGTLPFAAVVVLSLGAVDLASAADLKNHPLVEPYPGSVLTRREDAGFSEYGVVVALDQKGKSDDEVIKTKTAEGQLTRLFYENPKAKSALEIFTNYKEGLEAAGFKVLFQCKDKECGPGWATNRWARVNGMKYISSGGMAYLSARRESAGTETYVALSVIQHRHEINVLESKAMDRGLVTVTAAALERGLAADGKAVLDGVLFDTDKATIRSESKPALEVIAKFLKDHPNLKVFIVGHTDFVGALDYNLNLSRERAQAVANALTKDYGIAAARLSAHGVGPLSPAATNRNDPGKSQNRRVEMVERN